MAKKKQPKLSNSGMDIPDYVYESLARSLLPAIQAYYESAKGQKALKEWEAKQTENYK